MNVKMPLFSCTLVAVPSVNSQVHVSRFASVCHKGKIRSGLKDPRGP